MLIDKVLDSFESYEINAQVVSLIDKDDYLMIVENNISGVINKCYSDELFSIMNIYQILKDHSLLCY
jgi:hypothetical protein